MQAPDWFTESITNLRGRNIYGDPILRVVWAPEQRDFQQRARYLWPDGKPMECWVLERWLPAGFFGSREEWEKTAGFYDDVHQEWVDIKGPFPERGRYALITPLMGRDGPAELNSSTLAGIREKVAKDEEFADLDIISRDHMVHEHHAQQQRASEYEADKRQEYIREYYAKNWYSIDSKARTGYSITPR